LHNFSIISGIVIFIYIFSGIVFFELTFRKHNY